MRSRLIPIALLGGLLSSESLAGAACPASAVRWASSSRRVYVTGAAVSCTPGDLALLVSTDVLRQVDPVGKVWLLRASVILQEGAALVLRGAAAGGDTNELRLLSNDSSSTGAIVYLRAHWGSITLDHVKVTSWDEAAGGPDTRPDSNGRAFIHVRSLLDVDGVTPRESRMDIHASEVGWLGYYAAESYGLTWKVYGTTPGLFDRVNVLGDVTDSYIHHNYFGAYTYGAHGMNWLRNEIAHNVQYGLDPHDDSDFLVIRDNHVHHNGNHGIICSKRCNDLVIAGNISHDNAGNGIMIHRQVTGAVVEDNQSYDNGDSGVAVFDCSGNVIRNNHLAGNRRGIRVSVGAEDNLVEGNEIAGSEQYGIYLYKGSDIPTAGDGHPRRNAFVDNYVHDNAQAMKSTLADETELIDNVFAANAIGFQLIDGQGTLFSGNTIPADSIIDTKTSDSSSASTIITNTGTPVRVRASGGGIARFVETSTWTHRVDGLAAATTVTPTEGTLTLASAQISSARTVSAVPVYAVITSGTLSVTPASGFRSWSARAPSGTVTAEMRVSGLTPGNVYTVLRNGATFATAPANGEGVLAFTDAVGTATTTYSVEP